MQRGLDYQEMARSFEAEFFRDMGSLNVLPPAVKTRVTDYIPQIQDFIQQLCNKGLAYSVPSGQYFVIYTDDVTRPAAKK